MEKQKQIKICALSTISKTMDWFIVDNMRNLSKNGYDVTLICNMDDGFAERNADYAKCIDIKMKRGTSFSDLIRIPLKLRKIFAQEKFDVLYYMSPNVSFYASLAGMLAGVKIRIYSQTGLRYVTFTGVKRKVFKLLEKLTCRFSTCVKAQSAKNMEYAVEEGLCSKGKISVVGIGGTTGVDLSQCDSFDHKRVKSELRNKYHIPQDAFVYGYVGRINADKGINELICAFSEFEKKHPNVYLALVGMVDDTNPIDKMKLQTAKDDTRIIMTGNVPVSAVYPHMAMFDVLVHPTYREGFGKVLQEAMGMSIPIITTDVPGPSEVVEKDVSGILVKVRDAQALESGMELLYSDAALRRSIAEAGRKRAETYFDRPIMLNNILEDLNILVGRK